MLYQFGVPLACGGLVLYDCCTQVSIASPRVRAGVSKKKETLCLQCRNGGGEYRARKERSDGILARCFAWRSGKRRRKGIAISNRHCVCSWRRRQVGWLIRLLHASVNRVTAGESRRRQKKETLCLQCRNDGGEYRARTCDPLLVRQMLSQLS